MSCSVCSLPVGSTSAERKAHLVIHGYPRCEQCPRVFKNVKSFEKHITEQHETKKCHKFTQSCYLKYARYIINNGINPRNLVKNS